MNWCLYTIGVGTDTNLAQQRAWSIEQKQKISFVTYLFSMPHARYTLLPVNCALRITQDYVIAKNPY
jgi:hypothetical protein